MSALRSKRPAARAGRGGKSFVGIGLLVLASCGGGGGSPTPTPAPAPVNQAPSFTSAATATFVENGSGIAYQATASDPEGNALTFSVAGGADAGRFTIMTNGQLRFATAPNFDLPGDADGNNVYQVVIAVSDGQATSSLALSVTVTNSTEGIVVRRVASGFMRPVAVSPVSDTLVLVAQANGAVYTLNPQTGARNLLVQIPTLTDRSLVGMVAARDYATTGAFFVMYVNTNNFLIVERYLRNPAGPVVPDNFGAVLAFSYPQVPESGWLGLDADGSLLIATPDRTSSLEASSAQFDNSRLGKVIRARANPDPYAGASPVFFLLSDVAKGLRAPNGGVAYSGGLLIADRGQQFRQEINLLSPIDGTARNFGWPFKEGSRTVQGSPPAGLVDPVIEYDLAPGMPVGEGIVGGTIGGSAIASLSGQYLFGDRGGALFSIPVASITSGQILTPPALERRNVDFQPDAGTIGNPAAITGDASGIIYILDEDGELFRVTAG